MFSKVKKLDKLLNTLGESLKRTEQKRYTANQMLRAEDIHLAEGANLTINMNNMIMSIKIVAECIEVVNELKMFLPVMGELGLDKALNNYKNALVVKTLEKTNNNLNQSAKLLGISKRQMRYINDKRKEKL